MYFDIDTPLVKNLALFQYVLACCITALWAQMALGLLLNLPLLILVYPTAYVMHQQV
jgi:hypothetical protein